MQSHSNRESWLHQCATSLNPLFSAQGVQLPDRIRIACGWPSSRGLSEKNQALGECWESATSADGCVEIFINPTISDPVLVAETLVHELVHAVGIIGHGRPFKRLAEAVGLIGPMKATRAGDALREHLQAIIAQLDQYPHAALDPGSRTRSRQTTRLRKAVCPADGYTIRITRKWIAFGLPACPCGAQMIEEASTS